MVFLLTAASCAAAGVTVAAAWLVYSEAGLAWALAYAERAAGGSLQLGETRGTLAGGVTLSRVRYSDRTTNVDARDLSFYVSPRSLLALAPRIAAARCEELNVTLVPGADPPRLPATLALPVTVEVSDARVARAVISRGEASVALTEVSFAYEADAGAHRLRMLSLTIGGVAVTGNGTVGATPPFPVAAAIAARSAAYPAATVNATLNGTLEALHVAAKSESGPARATLEALFAPFTMRPLERLRAELAGVDLRAFDARLPRTAMQGELALSEGGGAVAGTLVMSNSMNGSHDRDRLPLKSLRATVRTDMATLQLSELKADLGSAGTLTGSGTLAPTRLTLALRASELNLAGLQGRLRKTRLAGRIDVAATMETQSLNAALAEGPVYLDLNARRSGDLLELHELRARARGGEARAHGRITLAGAQPFSAEGQFKGFDPAAWGDFPSGALSGRFSARGALRNRHFEAELALEPSRLRGAPLTGSGRAEMTGDRIAATIDLDLGGNRLEARGAFGGSGESLSARIDAPRLSVVDPRLSGRVAGTAQLTGTWRSPDAKFELAGKELAFAERWRAASVTATGVYAAKPDGPLEISAATTGVVGPGSRIDRATLNVNGTRLKHTAMLTAQGGAVDLVARASGSSQEGRGWTGMLHEAANRGSVPVVLEAPVAIEAGPDRLRLGAVAVRAIGGRLDVRGASYDAGRLASEGRFAAIPARTVLALAGMPADPGGTLTLAGSWSLSTTPGWNGTISVRRDAGDIALGAGNTTPLGLETLTMDARVIDDRIELSGALRSRVANGQVAGSVLPAPTPRGSRITAASPLRLTGNIEVERLAALSVLAGATLRFDGRVRAKVAARGTLREPLVTGIVEASNLSVAYPPEGVDLRSGALRAELAEREIRVQSFSIRGGNGTLTASGILAQGAERRAALDWRAERLTLMSRPDRRLVVTGRGNATLEGAKLSLTGEARADEGMVELRASDLPAPGSDVVIVGRKREAPETPALRRAALDLALDFGDNFRMSGRGLDTHVSGRIRVRTSAVGDLIAKGELRAVRGAYVAFGQRLELEQGRLIFDGPIDNPRLDIRAMRKNQSVEAGVQVSGTVRSPFVRVVSDPPLPEGEALSWLVLGHSSRDTSSGDLGMLPLAAAALLNPGQSPGGFARSLGLDSIGMRRDTVAGQFITVGKRISDDIYVVYEQGLGATAHVLKLEYNLTRRWLLRAEAGDTSAIGIFFRWAFD